MGPGDPILQVPVVPGSSFYFSLLSVWPPPENPHTFHSATPNSEQAEKPVNSLRDIFKP